MNDSMNQITLIGAQLAEKPTPKLDEKREVIKIACSLLALLLLIGLAGGIAS